MGWDKAIIMMFAMSNMLSQQNREEQLDLSTQATALDYEQFEWEKLMAIMSMSNKRNGEGIDPMLMYFLLMDKKEETPPPPPPPPSPLDVILDPAENLKDFVESDENFLYKTMDWATAGAVTKTAENLGQLWGDLTYSGARATKGAFGYSAEEITAFYKVNPTGNFYNDVVQVSGLGQGDISAVSFASVVPTLETDINYTRNINREGLGIGIPVETQNYETIPGGDSIANALKQDSYMTQVVSSPVNDGIYNDIYDWDKGV